MVDKGLLKKMGLKSITYSIKGLNKEILKRREITLYGPGVHFDEWREHYLRNREELRLALNLPSVPARA